jgi:PIN domain nuclease of toxin-antitoxin system
MGRFLFLRSTRHLGSLSRISHFPSFDRLLIWQAISRKLTFISHDKACAAYKKHGLKVIW